MITITEEDYNRIARWQIRRERILIDAKHHTDAHRKMLEYLRKYNYSPLLKTTSFLIFDEKNDCFKMGPYFAIQIFGPVALTIQ